MNCELRKGKKIYIFRKCCQCIGARHCTDHRFFFIKKKINKKKKKVCECIKSLTFKSHIFVIIGVFLRFFLIENGKLYFKPHNYFMGEFKLNPHFHKF